MPSIRSSGSEGMRSRNSIRCRGIRYLVPIFMYLLTFVHLSHIRLQPLFGNELTPAFLPQLGIEGGSSTGKEELVSAPGRQVSMYSSGSPPPSSAYAYCFLLARCDPDRPFYRGFLWTVLIAMHHLRSSGSIADFVVLIRMSENSTSVFPMEEEGYLHKLGGRIRFLPVNDSLMGEHNNTRNSDSSATNGGDTFDDIQLLKFHILESTEYRRVLFLDADTFPLCNLDYIFRLSDSTHFMREHSTKIESNMHNNSRTDYVEPLESGRKPELRILDNLIVAWTGEPSNGGFFMLRPGPNEFQHLKGILLRNHASRENSQNGFDLVEGWGRALQGTNDSWITLRERGQLWNFYAAQSDQGLLYYWTKYVKQNVTIITSQTSLQHWGCGTDMGQG
jgi:hypothetical protein